MNKKNPKILLITLFFVVWKIMGLFTIGMAQRIIPYLGFFPYKDQLDKFRMPHLISPMANFDGIHYLLIAKNGYVEFEQAFFPLYPLLIRFLTPFFNSGFVAGLAISGIFFLLGLFIFDRLFGSKNNYWLILFVLLFPTSFFFSAVYNEGLFFFLLAGTLYFLKKKNYFVSFVLAFLASLTRLIGVFLVIPIALYLISEFIGKNKFTNHKSSILNSFVIISPLFGLAVYSFYLWQTTGDPLFFLSSQPAFGANRSTHLIFLPQVIWRYLKIFTTAAHDFRYFVSIVEFVIFSLVFVVLVFDLFKHLKFIGIRKLDIGNYERVGLNLFSFANLILPTLTGTLSSVPRYAIMSVSFFIYLAEIKNGWVKMGIAAAFLFLQVILLAFFAQGYFIS